MKKAKYIFIYLLMFLISYKIQAQVKCEFDSIYGYQFDERAGSKIIKLNDNSYLLAGTTVLYGAPYYSYRTFLQKIDDCGNSIWKFEDTVLKTFIDKDDTKIIEENDGSINMLIYGNRLLKLDRNGSKIREVKVGDSSYNLIPNAFIKMNKNGYVFAGKKNNHASVLITDSMGNAIIQKNYYLTNNSCIKKVCQNATGNYSLIGFADSNLFHVTIDDVGNPLNAINVSILNSSSKYINLSFNYDSTNILYFSFLNNYKMYISRYSLNGLKLNENTLDSSLYNFPEIMVAPDNNIGIITPKNIFKLDTNFNVVWKDTLIYQNTFGSITREYYNAVFTNYNSCIIVGEYTYNFASPITHHYLITKKSYTYKYPKTLSISGPDSINTDKGQIQLSANITPSDALNQQVNWSISDTNIATITPTGIVKAKLNGTAIVRATATDNIAATQTKKITVSNQFIFVNAIAIFPSNNVITIPGAKVQLSTLISPTNASNKSIKWSINDSAQASLSSSGLLTVKTNETVTVTATAMDGSLVSTSKNYIISNQNSAINNLENNPLYNIYPNPASQTIYIHLNKNQPITNFELTDTKGSIIQNISIQKENDFEYLIDIKHLESGLYFLNISHSTGKSTHKLMVNK